jgi:hypothetical protein
MKFTKEFEFSPNSDALHPVAFTAVLFHDKYTSKTSCWLDTESVNFIFELMFNGRK